jgi:hypothetical protein
MMHGISQTFGYEEAFLSLFFPVSTRKTRTRLIISIVNVQLTEDHMDAIVEALALAEGVRQMSLSNCKINSEVSLFSL